MVKGISIAVPERKITAIMGPSGCGKTTFMRCINRMHELAPNAQVRGEVLLDGEDVYKLNPILLRRRIGMVFQRPNPFPTMSIYDNVVAGYNLNGARMARVDRDRIVEETLRRVTLWDEVKDSLYRRGTFLSGGQQQRLCIARALAMKPEILLLDEPTSALDPKATAAIEELIVSLKGGHHRPGHAQHPPGGAHLRLHGIHPPRRAGGVRPDEEAFHGSQGQEDGGIPLREVRIGGTMPIPQMDELKARLVAYGRFVEDMIEKSRSRPGTRSRSCCARSSTSDEPRANEDEMDLEEECTSLIARHQPMAKDLRTILMVLRDHERPGAHRGPRGEHRRGGARAHQRLTTAAPDEDLLRNVRGNDPHGGRRDPRLHRAEDAALGRRCASRTPPWTSLPPASWSALSASMTQDPSTIPNRASALLKIAGNLERIADLSTNIGEDVIYMTEGRVIKHHREEEETRVVPTASRRHRRGHERDPLFCRRRWREIGYRVVGETRFPVRFGHGVFSAGAHRARMLRPQAVEGLDARPSR